MSARETGVPPINALNLTRSAMVGPARPPQVHAVL